MSDDSRVEKLPVNAIAGHAPCSQFHRNCTCRDCTTFVTIRTGVTAERKRISDAIDRRIEAGRGIEACYAEAQTLAWFKRYVVERENTHV